MARPRKSIPSVVHHKPTGQARVRIAGKDFYLGRYGSKEARAAYAGHVRRIFRWGVSRQLVSVAVVQALECLDPIRAGRTAAREPGSPEGTPFGRDIF